MPHAFRTLVLMAVGSLVWISGVSAFQADDEEKKAAEAAREKKAFEALMRKAEDEYRVFFSKPEKVHEFWAAIKFEMDVGKFDLAALHLKRMLELPPEKADPELLKILDREGLSAFTRLQRVPLWSIHEPYHREAEKNVQVLLDRLRKSLEEHLSSPERIAFFIKNLSAGSREEREFAKAELNRSKERAVPYLVDALRLHGGKSHGDRIMEFMVEMDEDMVAPFLEVFKVPFPEPGDEKDRALRENDARDPMLRLALMDVIKQRNDIRRAKGFRDDARIVPYLWHIAGGGGKSRLPYSPLVRDKARDLLSYFLRMERDRLPRAEVALTDLAERYYQRRDTFRGVERLPLWRWDSEALAVKPIVLTPSQAREVFALRHAKEALDLAPTYQPAQIVLLSLQMETLYRPEMSKFLLGAMPEGKEMDALLARIDVDLLSRTLEKAMDENNVAVILGAIRALGQRGDALAAKLSPAGAPRGVVRALDYPDRRVQWAAVQAIVRMPEAPAPVIRLRVLDLIERQLATGTQPRALAIGVPDVKVAPLRNALKELGLQTIVERDFKKGFQRLQESAEYDIVFLHGSLGLLELPYYVNQLRADVDQGVLPIVVLVPAPKADPLTKEAEEKERLTGLKVIERRVREELARKAIDLELTVKDALERGRQIEALEKAYAKEKARRIEEFEEAFALGVARRRLAASKVVESKLERALSRQRDVALLPELHLDVDDAFTKEVERVLDDAYVARMTAEERAGLKKQSLAFLWEMSKGNIPGYSLAPAQESLLEFARSKSTPADEALLALEVLSRLPGAEVQQNLAAITLDPTRGKTRMAAALELNNHIKKFGVLLPRGQVKQIQKAYVDPMEDAKLRGQLALVLGAMGSSPRLTGERLFEFRPAPAAPPAEKKEKKADE